MDNYEILGVGANASKEDIRSAYEKRVKIINKEVGNKEKADLFKVVLKNAYDELMRVKSSSNNIGQVPEETIVMSVDEINNLLDEANTNDDEYEYYDDYDEYYDEDDYYYEDDYYDDYEDDYYDNQDQEEERRKKGNKKSNKNKKKISKGKKKKSSYRDDNEQDKERKRKKHRDDEYEEESSNLWTLPLRILAFPFVVILSVIIFILDIISAIIWVVTKVLIIASIGVIAIHGYQVYSGSELIRYEILAGAGAAFVVGIFLPLVMKILCDPLKTMNSSLKDFVF